MEDERNGGGEERKVVREDWEKIGMSGCLKIAPKAALKTQLLAPPAAALRPLMQVAQPWKIWPMFQPLLRHLDPPLRPGASMAEEREFCAT